MSRWIADELRSERDWAARCVALGETLRAQVSQPSEGLAARAYELATVCELAVPDRRHAVEMYLVAWKVDHQRLDALARARALCEQLGEPATVAKIAKLQYQHSRDAEFLVHEGRAWLDSDQPDRAVKPLVTALKARPGDPRIQQALATARREWPNVRGEIDRLEERARSERPELAAESYLDAARILRMLKTDDRHYGRVLQLAAEHDPSNMQACTLYEAWLRQAKDWDRLLALQKLRAGATRSAEDLVEVYRRTGVELALGNAHRGLGLRLLHQALRIAYTNKLAAIPGHLAMLALLRSEFMQSRDSARFLLLAQTALGLDLSQEERLWLAATALELSWVYARNAAAARYFGAMTKELNPEHPALREFQESGGEVLGDLAAAADTGWGDAARGAELIQKLHGAGGDAGGALDPDLMRDLESDPSLIREAARAAQAAVGLVPKPPPPQPPPPRRSALDDAPSRKLELPDTAAVANELASLSNPGFFDDAFSADVLPPTGAEPLAPPDDPALAPPDDAALELPDDAALAPPDDAALAPPDAALALPDDAALELPDGAALALPDDDDALELPDDTLDLPDDNTLELPDDAPAPSPDDDEGDFQLLDPDALELPDAEAVGLSGRPPLAAPAVAMPAPGAAMRATTGPPAWPPAPPPPGARRDRPEHVAPPTLAASEAAPPAPRVIPAAPKARTVVSPTPVRVSPSTNDAGFALIPDHELDAAADAHAADARLEPKPAPSSAAGARGDHLPTPSLAHSNPRLARALAALATARQRAGTNPPAGPPGERRDAVRVPVTADVTLAIAAPTRVRVGDLNLRVTSRDISASGAFVATPEALPTDTPIDLTIELPDGDWSISSFELRARVVRHDPGVGYGVAFDAIPAGFAAALAALATETNKA